MNKDKDIESARGDNVEESHEFHNDDQDKVSSYSKMNKKTRKGTNVGVQDRNDSSGSDNDESQASMGSETSRPFSLKDFYDYELLPESVNAAVLPWTDFTRDFLSLDIAMTPEVEQICHDHECDLIDLRPYMIENPEKCQKYDFLPKILSRFRHMHLRHLCVVNPTNGLLDGVITRQDIFRWMPL